MAGAIAALQPRLVPEAARTGTSALLLGERLAQRGLLQRDAIPAILKAQARWGCRFGEAAVAEGRIAPVELAETLAESHGLSFVDLILDPPDSALCKAEQIDLYLAHLFLPWRRFDNALAIACTDPSEDMRRLAERLYGTNIAFVVTAKFDITWTVSRVFRETLSRDASFKLDERSPEFSAQNVASTGQCVAGIAAAFLVAASSMADSRLTLAVLLVLLNLSYAANIVLRLALYVAAGLRRAGYRVTAEQIDALDEARLPVYTILAPLYREANMVGSLAGALKNIDYPAAKLDVKIVLEEEDTETIAAAKALHLDGRFEILIVPASPLRTKPRACNYALRFARGQYIVIYDAEDRPDRDQLKKAVAAFAASPRDVACFQARLNVYNRGDNWLTRMFALEYAGWFDFLLPGLGHLGIPIPLGGTSNHFRINPLRAVHGWDAFNVTEDADLGLRLARLGLRVVPIDSSTYEEAIPSLKGWIGQRSRWIKGYMQTALVHLRHPVEFAQVIGFWRFCGFVVFIAGAAATSLLGPLAWLLAGLFLWQGSDGLLGPYGGIVTVTSYACLGAGNLALVTLAVVAPVKRRWWGLVPYSLGVLAYWLLMSAAAYKAVWELGNRPHHWEKTEHGVAKGAARAAMGMRAFL